MKTISGGKMDYQIAIIVLLILVALAIYLAMATPKVVKISRTQLIQASAEKLFPYINNPRFIQLWNPFMDGDPNVKVSYSGPAEGVHAQWAWEGKKAGAGQATIVQSELNKHVSLRLDFKKPFHVTNHGEYVLVLNGPSTEVTWTINETALIPRVLSRFMNLERMIGTIFEKGLGKLKVLAEAPN
jgi:uncharacterized protein YndB with AHSA1/START domain